ncbi:MAG: ABC transporter ATP-binding protein [Eubacteriales bacterium]
MIEVKNLTKKYGDHTAVSNLNFTVEKGKIYGFLGPNGAGKSTTMNIITGCLAATEGQVIIDGHDIFEEPKAAKSHIGYLPEQPPVYPEMTPYEYLRFVGTAKGLRKADLAEQIERVINETQIDDVRNRLIKNLSKGYRQRVGIAQAMLGDPEIIILDEPTVGLDPKQIIEIRALIKSLGEQRTVILSSHILPEVSAICDYVMIISKGRLVASDTLENLSNYLTGDKTMDLTIRGEEGKIRMALNEIAGILEYEITPSKEGAGIFEIIIKSDRSADIREAVYFAFCDLRYPVLNMVNEIITLEDVFLRLTTDPDEVKEDALQLRENLVVEEFEDDDNEEDDSEDREETDEEEEDDDEDDDTDDDKKSGGDYKPMFK